jgi:hypothetical protein
MTQEAAMIEEKLYPEDLDISDGPHLTKAQSMGYYIHCTALPKDGSERSPRNYIWHQGGFWAKSTQFSGVYTGYFETEDDATASLLFGNSPNKLDPFEAKIAGMQVAASRRNKYHFHGGHHVRGGG